MDQEYEINKQQCGNFIAEEERKSKEGLDMEVDESDPDIVFQANLANLHKNLSKECFIMYSQLKKVYYTDPTNEIVRKSLHLSITGTIWTEALKFSPCPSITAVPDVFDSKGSQGATDIWSGMSVQEKTEITDWINKKKKLPSQSTDENLHELWGFIFKKLVAAVRACKKYRNIRCFSRYNTTRVKQDTRKNYCTDFVLSRGSLGLPLLMVEIATGEATGIHKHTRKLAFQMGEVLLHLIGAIRKKRKNEESLAFIPNLRVFGALITGTQIQLCVSRPQVSPDGKFVIIFETKLEEQEWTFDLCKCRRNKNTDNTENTKSTAAIKVPVELLSYVGDSEPDQFKDLLSVFTSLNTEEAKCAENMAINDVARRSISMVSSFCDCSEVDYEAMASLVNVVELVHSYNLSLPGLIAYIYLDSGVSDDEDLLYKPVLPLGMHLPEADRSIDNSPFDIVPIIAPTNYIFPTLPNLKFTKPFPSEPESSMFRCDQYTEHLNLIITERWLESKFSIKKKEDQLSVFKCLFRAHFIVGTCMALYKAHLAGFVFDTFEYEDITFQDHLFCIRTYHHVKSISSPSAPTLPASFNALSALYYSFWFYDSYMTEGDAAYDALRRLEWSSFGKMKEMEIHGDCRDIDWSDFFTELLDKYERMEELSTSPETLFLLKHMMKSDNLFKDTK